MNNHILEIVNNLATINRLVLVVYLVHFFFMGNFKPALSDDLVIPDIHRHALCLAVALTVDKIGALIVGITIWLWRAMGIGGGAGVIHFSSVPGMVTGSLLMAFGTLLLIRILSIAKYGDSIWQYTLVADALYVVVEFIL